MISPSTIRKGYVDTRDGQVHFLRCEGGSGDPVVMIHMTSSMADSYSALMDELSGKYNTIACDSPNYGQSFRTDHEPSIRYMASVWLEALDGLGVGNFHVLGHHTGANIALEMAAQAPDRVRSLTLSGLVYSTQEENAASQQQYIKSFPINDYGTQLMGAWTRVLTTMTGTDLPAEFKHRETVGTLIAGDNWNWAYQAVFTYDAIERIKQVKCPMFAVTGELDPCYAAGFDHRLLNDYPEIMVFTPKGRGVDYMDTYAAEFAPRLIEFIDSL